MSDLRPNIKKARRWPYFAVAAILSVPMLFIFLFLAWLLLPIFMMERAVTLEKSRLSYRIDHSVLAASYDDLLNGDVLEKSKSGECWIKDEKIPSAIRVIKPNGIYFRDGAMFLEFGGGFHHFGLQILERPDQNRKLLDGEEKQLDPRTILYDHGG